MSERPVFRSLKDLQADLDDPPEVEPGTNAGGAAIPTRRYRPPKAPPPPNAAAVEENRKRKINQARRAAALQAQKLSVAKIGLRMAIEDGRVDSEGQPRPYDQRTVRRWLAAARNC